MSDAKAIDRLVQSAENLNQALIQTRTQIAVLTETLKTVTGCESVEELEQYLNDIDDEQDATVDELNRIVSQIESQYSEIDDDYDPYDT
jgi:predicted  nucleic acid-binding Zn-ribbon protein